MLTKMLVFVAVSAATVLPASGSVFAYLDSPTLLKNPYAVRSLVADAYVYGLVEHYDRASEFTDGAEWRKGYAGKPLPLCSADEAKALSSLRLAHECWAVSTHSTETCRDDKRCIELKVHETVRDDPELNRILIESVKNPCSKYPDSSNRLHWVGFIYPSYFGEGGMNCDSGRLPYRKAYLNYGADRVEVHLD